jgi:uridine kinase
MPMKTSTTPFFVGITGGSASGKTLFLNKLLELLPEDKVCLISQDNYYRDKDQQPIDENGVYNFDLPESLHYDEFARDIERLKNGETVTRKEYVFNNPNATPKLLEYTPAPIIVVEGLFVLHYPEVAHLLDLKLFIEAKGYIKLKRRIIRDSEERGYDLQDVLYRFEKHVMPSYEKFIEPSKYEADIIIPNNSRFDTALEVVSSYLLSKV